MTSSRKPDNGAARARSGISELPPALSSMWRLCKLGYRHEPRLMLTAFVLSLLAALPDALLALWLKIFGEGVLQRDHGLVRIAAMALGISVTATWFLRTVSTRVQRRFRDKVTIALESHVARLQASIATIAHHERPDISIGSRFFATRSSSWITCNRCFPPRMDLAPRVTVALLATIHPALVLLAAFAVPTVLTSTWRPAVERLAQERGAPASGSPAISSPRQPPAAPGKRCGSPASARAWSRDGATPGNAGRGPVAAARWGSAVWHSLAWAVFGGAYVGAIVFVSFGLNAPAGSVLLLLAAGSRLSAYVGATAGEIGFLRGIWMDGSKRLAWLEDYAASFVSEASLPAPSGLTHGIRFEHVSFAYPGTERLVLDDVSLDLPAGAVIALDSKNGAGESTLVNLLCKLYEASAGGILVDGQPVSRMPADAWRARVAGAFQDFFRFEFRARHTVGVGDVPPGR